VDLYPRSTYTQGSDELEVDYLVGRSLNVFVGRMHPTEITDVQDTHPEPLTH
jgi:hypothetical protein